MHSVEQVRAGVMAGVLAAAASGGGVLALAWRAGAPLRPYVESGRAIIGGAPPGAAALLGLGLHLAVAVGWGLVLALLAQGRRGPVQLLASVAVALAALAVHSSVLPAFRLGFGLGVFPLHGAPLLYLYALFAVGLAGGLRLAR